MINEAKSEFPEGYGGVGKNPWRGVGYGYFLQPNTPVALAYIQCFSFSHKVINCAKILSYHPISSRLIIL